MAVVGSFASPNSEDIMAVQEAMRRRSGAPASGAGIPGGMPTTNATTPGNPVANAGMTTPQQTSKPGAAGFPSGAGVKQLDQSQPNEAQIITKALIRRQEKLSEAGA